MPIQVNLRVSDELRAKLIEAAEKRGVSLNLEINERLEASLQQEVLKDQSREDTVLYGILSIIGAAMRSAGRAAAFFSTYDLDSARQWLNEPFAFEQAVIAAKTVLEACRPRGELKPPSGLPQEHSLKFGLGFANGVLEEAATGRARTAGTMERAKLLHDAIGPELAQRLSVDLPREPLMIQALGPGSTSVVATLTNARAGGRRRRTRK